MAAELLPPVWSPRIRG